MSYDSLVTPRHQRFLHRPGPHSDSSVMGEIVVQRWAGNGPSDLPDHPDEVVPYVEAFLRIRDCSRAVSIEIELSTEEDYENTIEKLERLETEIRKVREDLPTARRIFLNARDDALAATGLREAKEAAAKPSTKPETDIPPPLASADAARLAFLEELSVGGPVVRMSDVERDELLMLRRKGLPADMGSRGPKPFPPSPFASSEDS